MALTIVQQPATVTDYKFIHGSTYPTFYTATDTLSSTKSDFKYVFTTKTSDGVVGNTKNSPRILEGLGAFDSQPIVNNLVSSMFQPTITNWTTCSDLIRQYRVDIQEFYDGIVQTPVTDYAKALVFKQNKEDFIFSNYVLTDSTKKMLTDKTGITPIRRTDYSTMRLLNASMYATTYAPYISQPYSILYTIRNTDGSGYIYSLHNPNPYWYTTIPINSNNLSFDDQAKTISKRILEIPTGPKNLSGVTLDLIWVLGTPGNPDLPISPAFPTPGWQVFMNPNMDYYDVSCYTWPLGYVSKQYRYKIVCDTPNKPPIQLQWENLLGGMDSFLFTLVNTKTNSYVSNTMQKNKYQQGHASTYSGNKNHYIGNNIYDRGTTQIYNEQTTTYTLNTDFLTQAQCNDLESLWQSNYIFANIDGTYNGFVPVVSLSEAVVIKTTKAGLRQYSVDVQLSNKKYNL